LHLYLRDSLELQPLLPFQIDQASIELNELGAQFPLHSGHRPITGLREESNC
jgi:hypothetical protein